MSEDELRELAISTREQVKSLVEINMLLVESLEDIGYMCRKVSQDVEFNNEARELSRVLANDCVKALEAAKLLAINYGRMQ